MKLFVSSHNIQSCQLKVCNNELYPGKQLWDVLLWAVKRQNTLCRHHTCHYHVKSNMQILCQQLAYRCITLANVTCLWTGLEKCVECIQMFVFMTKACIHQGAIIYILFKKEKVVDRLHTSLIHTLLIHNPRKQCACVTCVLRPCSSEHSLARLEAATRAKHWTPHSEGPEKPSNTSCSTIDPMISTYRYYIRAYCSLTSLIFTFSL